MTNIRTQDMWPTLLPGCHAYPSSTSIKALFELRKRTYTDFAEIEKEKGLLRPHMSLSTSEGQEAVRILTQRGLEELAEAWDSDERDHYLEELIDAINYFWVLAILDPQAPLEAIVHQMSTDLIEHIRDYNKGNRITAFDIGATVIALNPIFEKLRHRAWMHQVQSPYFDGWGEIISFLSMNLCMTWDQFESWPEFVRYFIAKDNVLQFRIQSKY